MGIYIYTVRSKNKKVALQNGSIVTAHLLSYAYKDFWGAASSKSAMLQHAAADHVAEKYDPQYVVIGDTFEEGNSVKKWDGRSYSYDSDFAGEHIGYLKQVSPRKFKVVEKRPLAG